MARTRTVKPTFFKDAELYDAEVQYGLPLRLAYEGLWCQADREGRFLWKPRELKLDILPYDPVDFDRVLNALAEAGFIERYEVDGRVYGLIPNLKRHQHFHKTEAASTLPAPVANGATTVSPPLSHRDATPDTDTDTDTEGDNNNRGAARVEPAKSWPNLHAKLPPTGVYRQQVMSFITSLPEAHAEGWCDLLLQTLAGIGTPGGVAVTPDELVAALAHYKASRKGEHDTRYFGGCLRRIIAKRYAGTDTAKPDASTTSPKLPRLTDPDLDLKAAS